MHLCICAFVLYFFCKNIFLKMCYNLVEKSKQLCPPNFSVMLFYHYKFRFMDVKGKLITQVACNHTIIWITRNIKTRVGKKFGEINGSIWVEKQKNCICKKWKRKFEFYNCSIEIYYELWSRLSLEENFQGISFGHAFLNVCYNGWESL